VYKCTIVKLRVWY